MAEFPSNLDDRELCLASDGLQDEIYAGINPKFPSELTYMDELAQQLSSYTLLERSQIGTKPPLNFSPSLEVRPASRYGSVAPRRTRLGIEYSGGSCPCHNMCASGCGRGRGLSGFRIGLRPIYQFPPKEPAFNQEVERLARTRSGVFQRPQNQVHNRFLPFQVNKYRVVGSVRQSLGTGVFIPRVSAAVDVRKKQSAKNEGEAEERHTLKKVAVGVDQQLPPLMGLPHEWSY